MSGIVVNGVTKYATGVYSLFEVLGAAGPDTPPFNIPVIIGKAYTGIGFDGNNGVAAQFQQQIFNKYFGINDVISAFGNGSDMAFGFAENLRHGGTASYFLVLNDNTASSFNLASSVPTNLLHLVSKVKGSLSQDINVAATFTAGPSGNPNQQAVSFSKPMDVYYLSQDAQATDHSFTVQAVPQMAVGDTLTMRNDSTPTDKSVKVTALTKNTQTVQINGVTSTITTSFTVHIDQALGAGYTQANNARAFVEKPSNYYVETFNYPTVAQLQAAINAESELFYSDTYTEGNFANVSSTRVSNITGAVLGTTGYIGDSVTEEGRWTALLNQLSTLLANFKQVYGVDIRLVLAMSGDVTVHDAVRDATVARRTLGKPLSVLTGTELGVINPTSTNSAVNPVLQAADLNSQDVALCVGGWNGMAAYKTFAPAVLGRRLGNILAHNLTDDELLGEVPEVVWNKDDGTMDSLLIGGCLVYDYEGGLHIEKGQNTLQNQTFWDATHDSTYLIMQRDLADYHIVNLPLDLQASINGTQDMEIDAVAVTLKGNKILGDYQTNGYNNGGNVTSVVRDPNNEGWDIQTQISIPRENNYGLVTIGLKI